MERQANKRVQILLYSVTEHTSAHTHTPHTRTHDQINSKAHCKQIATLQQSQHSHSVHRKIVATAAEIEEAAITQARAAMHHPAPYVRA